MTYVISDIHGEYEKYIKMLKEIDFRDEDILYVLGDVVDRGPEPIKILQDMMCRANVYPIMGNHDLYALYIMPKLSKALSENREKFDDDLSQALKMWYEDGGLPTITGFCDLGEEQREDIIDYLREFTLLDVAEIDDKSFVLVHAGLGNYRPGKKLSEYTDDELLTTRPDPSQQYFDDETVYVVMGHTPTAFFGGKPEIYKSGRNIFIDCGACSPEGKLSCLCLETMEEFYV